MAGKQLKDLIILARQVEWRYKLDNFENAALKEILASVDQARKEIITRIAREDYVKVFEGIDISDNARSMALLDELEDLTVGVRSQLKHDLTEIATIAGVESYPVQNDILSFGGRVVNFSTVSLTANQLKSMVTNTPVGGKLLADWVDSTFDTRMKQEIKRDIMAGMFLGEGYPDLVKRIEQGFGVLKRDAETLARTYVQSVNVNAMESVYKANQDIVKRVEWSAVLEPGYLKTGRGTCIRCSRLDGEEYAHDEEKPPMPLHPRCLTPETPVFSPDKIAAFVAPYDGPVVDIGLSNGARFSVTPNHMFLTVDGFVKAKDLGKGSNILYDPDAQRVILGNPNDNRCPSRIDNQVEAFSKSPGVSSKSMPTAAENFHGDAEFFNGDINIIGPDSLLRGDFEAFFVEQARKFHFGGAGNVGRQPLPTKGDFAHKLMAFRFAALGFIGGPSISDVFGPSSLRHHQSVGRDDPANRGVGLDKYSPNCSAGNAELFGKAVFGLPSGISFGDILNREFDPQLLYDFRFPVEWFDPVPLKGSGNTVGRDIMRFRNCTRRFASLISTADVSFYRVRNFTGHVYDLQSFSSLYYVNGAVSSNCRCVWLPVTATWRELGIDIDEIEDAYRPYTMRPNKNIDAGGRRTIIEQGFHDGNYASFFGKQSRAFQVNAVGPGRFDMLDKGQIQFADLVDRKTGRLFTIDELMNKYGIQGNPGGKSGVGPLGVKTRKDAEKIIIEKLSPFATNNGINEVRFIKDGSPFMSTNAAGRISIYEKSSAGFKPSRDIMSAFRNIGAKELSFNEEYALESLWHEITHNRQSTKKYYHDELHPKRVLLETVTQWTARRTYQDMLEALGGFKPANQKRIIESGYGYWSWVKNLDELLAKTGIEDSDILKEVRSMVDAVDANEYRDPLAKIIQEAAGKTDGYGQNIARMLDMLKVDPFDFKDLMGVVLKAAD